MPEGVSPEFYIVDTVTSGTANKGAKLSFENGIVKVPENVSRIMWEADGVIGMSAAVSSGKSLELVNVSFEVKDYFDKIDTEGTVEITDSEGVKISGKTVDTYLLPVSEGFTYKVTSSDANYHLVQLTAQTPAEGKVEIKLDLKHFAVIAPNGYTIRG